MSTSERNGSIVASFPVEDTDQIMLVTDGGQGAYAEGFTLSAADFALKFEKKHDTCAECHEDPHGGQFAGRDRGSDCGVCHGSAAFRPPDRFDHDRDARFALAGAHATVACDKCHPVAARPDGTDGPIYRPLEFACEDCHATPPSGVTP